MTAEHNRIVLFDGVCNFCDAAVNFIIDHDPTGKFRFASLQSALGRELRARYAIPAELDSLVLIEDGRAHTESSAALRIARQLTRPWVFAYALRAIPRPLRDLAYRAFAARRYQVFGRTDVCRLPTPAVRERFLDLAPVG